MKSCKAAILAAVAAQLLAACATTQPARGPTPAAANPGATSRSDAAQPKTIASVTRSSRKVEGLFPLYQDTVNGSVHMAIDRDQLGKEYIYFMHAIDGPVAAGTFRGQFRENGILSIRKRFNKVEFVLENPRFHFDPQNALSRSSGANISPAVVAVQEVVARDTASGTILIKADDIFLTEALAQIKPSPNPTARPGARFSLGSLSKAKTKYLALASYPLNTDVVVEYVYENPAPVAGGGPEVVDARNVSIRVQHTLIQMPDNDFRPRLDDARVGYFTEQVNDMTSLSATPYRDLVQRWHLAKKNPGEAISEPVEPIVFWIENTTPVELRATIRDAVLAWNEAFEAAGFRDALRVEVQPDDAEWEAGDIRYNVLRWTSSPTPPFGGYGPSFTNPRTGQILGADIMLEYIYLANRLRQDRLFSTAALPVEAVDAPADPKGCTAGLHLHQTTMAGMAALRAQGADSVAMDEYMRQAVFYLVLHEVGHTLGLNHNMKASQMLSPAELHDRSLTQRVGLMGSVMDYPAVNLAAPGQPQGDFFAAKPGPYDVWAIRFGYTEELEGEARDRLLARSTEPALAFGNDADDMRAPGRALDPRVMINDMSSDVLTYSEGRFARLNETLRQLRERYSIPGESYHELRTAYLMVTSDYANAAAAVSRYLGGVYVDRAVAGQAGASQPFTPVARGDQKRALSVLSRHLFAPDAFGAPADLYAHLAMQRRGFDHFGVVQDPKIHDRVLAIQRNVLDHLLHPQTLSRMIDTRLYGNEYPVAEYMRDLTDAVFAADARGNVNTFRQNLQLEYVSRLAGMVEPKSGPYGYIPQSAAMQNLRRIEGLLSGRRGANAETTAHTENVLFQIRRALDPR